MVPMPVFRVIKNENYATMSNFHVASSILLIFAETQKLIYSVAPPLSEKLRPELFGSFYYVNC